MSTGLYPFILLNYAKKKQSFAIATIIVLLLIFEGCAMHPVSSVKVQPKDQYVNPPMPANFEVQGKVAARVNGRVITVATTWTQKVPCTYIHAAGPLGLGAGDLESCPGSVTLKSPFTGEKRGTNLEQFVYDRTGYNIPVGNISYWLNGVPASSNAAIILDKQKRTQIVDEGNWRATMVYTGPDSMRPSRVEITPLAAAIQGGSAAKPVPADTRIIFVITRRSEAVN